MHKSLNRKKQGSKGFTLAELLIALAILGVIASFAIPAVLNAQQDGQMRAGLKTALSAASQAVYSNVLNQTLPAAPNQAQTILDSLNSPKKCAAATFAGALPTNCFNTSLANGGSTNFGGTAPGTNWIGAQMPNGAVIGILSANELADAGTGSTGSVKTVVVDWNGGSPPNTVGQDQLVVTYATGIPQVLGTGGTAVAGQSIATAAGGVVTCPAGTVINSGGMSTACSSTSAGGAGTVLNTTLYNRIFTAG